MQHITLAFSVPISLFTHICTFDVVNLLYVVVDMTTGSGLNAHAISSDLDMQFCEAHLQKLREKGLRDAPTDLGPQPGHLLVS